MRLETWGMQTVFNITMLKLKIKQKRNIQNNTKRKKKRGKRIGISAFCIYLHVSLVLCMTQSLVQKQTKAVANCSSNAKCWNVCGTQKGAE